MLEFVTISDKTAGMICKKYYGKGCRSECPLTMACREFTQNGNGLSVDRLNMATEKFNEAAEIIGVNK